MHASVHSVEPGCGGGGAAALPVLESCDNVDVNSWANHPFKHPLFLATFTFSVPFFILNNNKNNNGVEDGLCNGAHGTTATSEPNAHADDGDDTNRQTPNQTNMEAMGGRAGAPPVFT